MSADDVVYMLTVAGVVIAAWLVFGGLWDALLDLLGVLRRTK